MDILDVDEAEIIKKLLVLLKFIEKLSTALHLFLDICHLIDKIVINCDKARLLNLLSMSTIFEVKIFIFFKPEIMLSL